VQHLRASRETMVAQNQTYSLVLGLKFDYMTMIWPEERILQGWNDGQHMRARKEPYCWNSSMGVREAFVVFEIPCA
jgi:hypothetical protein